MTTAIPALGRLLLALIFITGGWSKIGNPGLAGYIAAHGLPLPQLGPWVAIIVELGGGLAILFGLLTRPVAAVMAVWCLVLAFLFHYVPGDQANMINFMKNVAIAGGFLQLVAWGAGDWSIDALLARRRTVPAHA